jgi:signal transduction histidine kinase
VKGIDGRVESAIEVAVDITEKKNLQEKLAQYSQKLEKLVEERTKQLEEAQHQLVKSERLAAIGELAGMVGHDLRNPLTGIKNAAYYMRKKATSCPNCKAKEMLEIIDKSIDYSNKIINDLLDYSREVHLDLTECTLRILVDEATRMIQVPDRIQIVNHVPEETRISADADKMMRVFINLIKNAIDAMPENGELEITSRQAKDTVEIVFADTGMGIPEEILPKIFSPLLTTKAQGMGFGLAICKRLVELHGGTITVKTAVKKGTMFTITLPIEPKVEIGGEGAWINMPESLSSTMTKTLERPCKQF